MKIEQGEVLMKAASGSISLAPIEPGEEDRMADGVFIFGSVVAGDWHSHLTCSVFSAKQDPRSSAERLRWR